MYGIFFKWVVRPGKEQQFVAAWSELTLLIREQYGGLGSRLHAGSDGSVFAYAQWPSEEDWKREREFTPRVEELRRQMAECAELVEGPLGGPVLQDLLV
jgi:heme-degrading monooxygenase HmoA